MFDNDHLASSSSSGLLQPMIQWPGEPRTSLPHRRTKQACDNCKARKAKCSNTKPCTNCQEADILCTSVKAMKKKPAREWEIEMLRAERTRLANAVKFLHQQLAERAPEFCHLDPERRRSTTTKTTASSPPSSSAAANTSQEKLSVNEIVELIELRMQLQQKRKSQPTAPDVLVTEAAESAPSSSPGSCASSPPVIDAGSSSVGGRLGERQPTNSGLLTPSNTPLLPLAGAEEEQEEKVQEDLMGPSLQQPDVVESGFNLSALGEFSWQPPGSVFPSWAGMCPEFSDDDAWRALWNGLQDLPDGPRGVDELDQLSMEWLGEGEAP